MMRGILADINVGKQRRAILAIWASEAWRDHDLLPLPLAIFAIFALSKEFAWLFAVGNRPGLSFAIHFPARGLSCRFLPCAAP
jgi:hypothetical protein